MGAAEVDLPHLADAGLRGHDQAAAGRQPPAADVSGRWPVLPGQRHRPGDSGQPADGDLDIYWRSLELGPRTNQAETEEFRILLGASGLAWGWDYNVGTYYVSSEVTDTYLGGYLLESKLLPAMLPG